MNRMDNPIDRSFFLIPIVNMGGRYCGINLEHFTRHRNCYRHYRSYKREAEA